MVELLKKLPSEVREKLREKALPEQTSPMLATLTDERFSRNDWIYERKLDGERCLAYKKGDEVKLMSRNEKLLNKQYPEIEEAVQSQEGDFIIDGEIVAFDGKVTSFSKLQNRMHRRHPDKSIEVFYYVFDILHLEGYDVTGVSQRHRKGILRKALDFSHDHIRYTTHRNKEGEKYFAEACRKHWEGLIAKDANASYKHSRSGKWLKFKCENQQELVICGYTDPEGSRDYFGALIVGFYKNDKLHFAGRVGTGYDDQTLEMLFNKMKPLRQNDPPFDVGDIHNEKNTHWLKPRLVGEFRFTEWTGDDKLRHPSFIGLRDDKKAKDVKKEEAAS